MNTYKDLTLFVHEGNYDLPSIDAKCLQILFFLKLHPNHKVTIITTECTTNPLIPSLLYKKESITDQKKIFQVLKSVCGPSCDSCFTYYQRSQITEHNIITYNFLDPLYVLYCWAVRPNARYFRQVYCREKHSTLQTPYLRNLARYIKRRVLDIRSSQPKDISRAFVKRSLTMYLTNLEAFLDKKKFMFGEVPSTFDAHLCGYLAPLLRFQFPDAELQIIVLQHKNICKYVDNFMQRYGEIFVDRPLPDYPRRCAHIKFKWSIIGVLGFCSFMFIFGLGIYAWIYYFFFK